MRRILDLFRSRKATPVPSRSMDEILADILPHAAPALSLEPMRAKSPSYLGGNPILPQEILWPVCEGRELTFLACIDLAQVAQTGVVSWLPEEGRLLFFYDVDGQPWGFHPADKSGWAVIYCDPNRQGSETRARLPQRYVSFEPISTMPSWERLEKLGLTLSDADVDKYHDEQFDGDYEPSDYRIGGYPVPIQGDEMELESQLASNGVDCGGVERIDQELVRKLRPGADDWRLLLQFPSDDDLGVMWGDVGNLYFWVREQDARQGDFSRTWLVLQCF